MPPRAQDLAVDLNDYLDTPPEGVEVNFRLLGHTRTWVRCIDIPRDVFVREVLTVLADEPEFDPIAAQMLRSARTIAVFPFHTWGNAERGCGCLVGEYIIAAEEIEREEVTNNSVAELIDKRENSTELRTFGSKIDVHLSELVSSWSLATHQYRTLRTIEAIYIVDPDPVPVVPPSFIENDDDDVPF
jgi:hypothetical protein